jgi:hypothetical protein
MKGDIGPRRRDRDETGGRLPRRRDGEAGKESWCEVESGDTFLNLVTRKLPPAGDGHPSHSVK